MGKNHEKKTTFTYFAEKKVFLAFKIRICYLSIQTKKNWPLTIYVYFFSFFSYFAQTPCWPPVSSKHSGFFVLRFQPFFPLFCLFVFCQIKLEANRTEKWRTPRKMKFCNFVTRWKHALFFEFPQKWLVPVSHHTSILSKQTHVFLHKSQKTRLCRHTHFGNPFVRTFVCSN